MNLKAITSALLIAGLSAPSAFAADGGTITFNGSISNVTCTVNGGAPGNGPDFEVQMQGVSAGSFPNVGDIAGKTPFRIYVGSAGETECTNDTKVWAAFENGSTVDALTGALIVSGGATGVQIRLFDKADTPIDILGNNQGAVQETIADNQAVLVYASGYQRTGNVVAGEADSSVVYGIRFEP
ncbi:MAG TPA: fimbrial protein [Luteibacter sp.]|jgi:major type 1 subunit fimbrin (pilin)|nr:fimbrial protein [Luteibacter sp.]